MPTSAMPGTLVSRYTPSASSVAAISLSTEFLAPGHDDLAVQRPGAADDDPVGFHGRQVWPTSTAMHRPPDADRPPVASWRVPPRTDVAPVVAGRLPEAAARPHPARRPASKRSSPRATAGRRRSRRTRVRSRATSARSSTTADDRSTETIRYRLVIPWFGWLFALPAAQHVAPSAARRHASRGGRRPIGSTPRHVATLGLLAAASMSAAFANTLFTQTANFAADGFGIDERGQGFGGVDRAPRRGHRPPVRGARRSTSAAGG